MSTRAVSVRRRRKVLAIVAGGAALGVAGMVTLAAWNDNEWVFGGAGPDGDTQPGVGTSLFEVQQYAWTGATAPLAAATEFADFEENPGDSLIFNVDPSGLTPGDTIFAPVALKTTSDSIAGELQLQAAVAATGMPADDAVDGTIPAGALWDALRYSVAVTEDPTEAAACTAGNLTGAGDTLFTDYPLSQAIADAPQSLDAASGNVQYYCFAITLPGGTSPDDPLNQDLQGRTVFPAWQFVATSASADD